MGKLRDLRKNVLAALKAEPWPRGLDTLAGHSPKALIGPLYALLLEPDPLVRWRAATAFGGNAARLFADRPEDARQLMRQLMWRLNEESGNIAWGIPEAFGETLAAQPVLASEFHRVLASYIRELDFKTGDTFIDHAPLRRSVYWALARLAAVSPRLVLPVLPDLLAPHSSDDAESRGYAALAVGRLLPVAGDAAGPAREALAGLRGDGAEFDLYEGGYLARVSVGEVAGKMCGAS